MIEFFVDGIAVPQGSMKVIHGRVIHNRGSALAAWRSAVALSARQAGAKPHPEAVTIQMTFVMLKPKTVKRPEPSVAPDLDKLIRAVLDGLTAVAYIDDGQVTRIEAAKVYGERPGVRIAVSQL